MLKTTLYNKTVMWTTGQQCLVFNLSWHLAIFHGIFFVCILLVFGVIVQHAVLPYSAHHPLQSSFDCNQ